MTKITVDLIDHMGSDLSVVNAARVSFSKTSTLEPSGTLSAKDAKLIGYLARHKHKSPFNHAFASFRVKAPIFVARQLVKHEYMPWNEVSRRYVDNEPEFYVPETWRKRAADKKQGSSDEFAFVHPEVLGNLYGLVLHTYQEMLNSGVAPEQARMVLPQSMMTEWIWSGTLFAVAKMCGLRLKPDTQYETRIVAEEIARHMAALYPVSWAALMGEEK